MRTDPRCKDRVELCFRSASDSQHPSSVNRTCLLSLVVSMVLARLNYGSTTLADLPDQLFHKLQSVLNAAARLVCSGRKYDYITPLLHDLHWLPLPVYITFRLAVLAHRCLQGLAPLYLANELH